MFSVDKKDKSWPWYLILSLFVFFSFYFAIGTYPLFDNNEGLYASIAKQMLLYKEFIIPHLNCTPYIEKPPLLYWLLSLSFSFFGFTAFAARFVTATSAALLSLAIVYFAKKIKQPQIGIIGGIIFASSIGISIIARMVYFDMLFTLLISCTLFCLFYWQESKNTTTLRISYIFLGLAILTKGLIAGVLICGSFGLFLILERDFRSLYKTIDPIGVVLFLTVVLPWHIAAIIQHEGFAWHYLIEEHILRFLNQREPHDYYQGPIYYYLPRIMIYLTPWSLFIPLIFWRTKNSTTPEQKLLKFCWCWLLVPLLFFSISSAKANYYMIVSMPALALILGVKIKSLINYNSKTFAVWTAMILLITASTLGIALFVFGDFLQIDAKYRLLLIGVVAYGLAAGISILTIMRRSSVVIMMLAGLIIPIVTTMVSYIKTNKDSLSTATVGIYLAEQAKDKTLYIYQDFENISALAFYAPTCFKIIDSQSSDLYYANHLPSFKQWFTTKVEFLQNELSNQIYIVVPTKKLDRFYNEMNGIEFYLLKRFDRLVVLSNTKNNLEL